MLDIVDVAPLQGWKQQGAPHWLHFEAHRFTANAEGALEHYTGEVLRAVVPPEGWDDYIKHWPAAEALVKQLRAKAAAMIAANRATAGQGEPEPAPAPSSSEPPAPPASDPSPQG